MVLLGYLPVTKLSCFRKDDRSLAGYRLFHFAMSQILQPLIEAGKHGVQMNCADGCIRHIFPLLAAYIADHPEQCLICCNKENRCPTCTVPRDLRGELLDSCYRDPDAALAAIRSPGGKEFDEDGLRDVPQPFWADLPLANIFNCIVPDLLHQLHKGVFMNHLVKWTSVNHVEELDARFMRVPPYPSLRVFQKGISSISQWTGNEYRQMEKIFIGILAGLHSDPRVIKAARAILDFIYLAHYPSHSTSTLEQMQRALQDFHTHKQVFLDLGIRSNFNIPKLHWMQHYIASIIDFGSCDGLSTETSERLHIDVAKLAYRASNRKAYIQQMVVWLTRREKVRWFQGYLRWCADRQSRTRQSPPQLVANHLIPADHGLADAAKTYTDELIIATPDVEGHEGDDSDSEDSDSEGRPPLNTSTINEQAPRCNLPVPSLFRAESNQLTAGHHQASGDNYDQRNDQRDDQQLDLADDESDEVRICLLHDSDWESLMLLSL